MRIIVEKWGKHFLGLEGAAVGIGVTVFAGFLIGYGCDVYQTISVPEDRTDLYKVTATVGGTLLGFTLTSFTIILGLVDDDRFALLRESKHYPKMWDTLHQTICSLGALTFVSITGLWFDQSAEPNGFVLTAWFGITMFSILRLLRTIWILRNLTKIMIASR